MHNHADKIVRSAGRCPDIVVGKSELCTLAADTPDTDRADKPSAIDSFKDSLYEVLSCNSINAVAVFDIIEAQDFTLNYANTPFLTLIGKAAEQALGKPLHEIVPPDVYANLSSHVNECVQFRREVNFIIDREALIHAVRMLPQIENDQIVRVVVINMDITKYIHNRDRQKTRDRQAEQQNLHLDKQLEFESLIARALKEFMDSGIGGFDRCLSIFTRKLGEIMRADQCFICQRKAPDLFVHKTYWSQDDCPLFVRAQHKQDICSGRSSLPHINRLTIINDTHSKRIALAQELKRMGICAFLAIPICRDPHDYGLLGLTYMNESHEWTTAEIGMVKTAADTIMSAYLRLNVEKSLNENIRVLTEYDESLQDLLALKETLAEVSQHFLRAGSQQFNECASNALKDIGRLLDADGMRMFFRAADGEMEIFEWHEDGLPCRIGKEYGRLNAIALGTAEALDAPVAIDDTAEAHILPELAKIGAEEGLRSLLIVPACHSDGITCAFICFKAIGFKQWNHMDMASAKTFAEIFLNAYRLKRSSEACLPFPVID